ncbi:MAG TPA: RHS repeat-associated core domain-containing protein, partial [Pyrinomonadaceae bacterium]
AGDRRTVTYTNDSAGRTASLNSSATSYAPAASVSSIGYSSHNALATQTYGNNLIHAISYNNRLQPSEIKLGTSSVPTSIIDLIYSYGTTNNNGNVQSIAYNGGGLSYTQTFAYDALNRLTTAQENSGTNWSQTNGYDRYGNRWIDLGGGNQSLYFTTSNNRITGASYDNAGNLLNDGYHSYAYDAENKISKVDGTSAYVYDGNGLRVRKLVGENLRFIYGIGGQLLAEYSGSTGVLTKEYVYGGAGLVATIEPTAVNSNGTRYTTPDHLGSPRVITNSSAGVVSRHDYMPFGEEIGSGVGGRTVGMGFGVAEGLRNKFTSHERDAETGLDYMQARYYQGLQGRFTSADPLLASGRPANPQSWNRYAYVLNNPVRLIDPTGYEAKDDTNPDQGGQGKEPQEKPVKVDVAEKDGVKVTVTQLTEPVAFDKKPINGENRTGVGVQLVITVEEDGKPASGATGTEKIDALKGKPVQQNPAQVTLDAQGRASDYVTNSAPSPKNEQEFRNVVKLVTDPFVTEQKAVFSVTTSKGTVVEVTQTRSLTNQTPEGGLQPVDPALGTPGYTFKMDPIQLNVTRPKGN